MKRTLSRTVAVALALTAALALSACKDSSDASDGKSSDKSSSAQTSKSSSPSPTEDPKSAIGAISRYEDYLHAVGNKDTDTMCEIAKPAMDTVGGDCASNFQMMFQLFSADQLNALKTATIDKPQVQEKSVGEVFIPATAVKCDAKFSSDTLGDVTMKYQNDNWFIIDAGNNS
jgi:hypothetical protein